MLAFVVILILCSPVILGPLVIPALKRAKTEKALDRLIGEDGERLPQGLAVTPAIRPGRKVKLYCDVQVDANLTKVDCGGVLHHVVEEAPGAQPARLATVCFLCGRFEKSAAASTVLKPFDEVNDLASLERSVHQAMRREDSKKRSAA